MLGCSVFPFLSEVILYTGTFGGWKNHCFTKDFQIGRPEMVLLFCSEGYTVVCQSVGACSGLGG